MAHLLFIFTQLVIFRLVYCVDNIFQSDDVETYQKYYHYEELTRRLQNLAQRHPRISSLASVGRSVEGRELWVMRVTTHPITDVPGKPRFKYVGNMHGDEAVSRQVLVYLIEYLLSQYRTDPRVTDLVDSSDIYILPSMNPDGFEKATEGDCKGSSAGRENAKHVDLNRNFPDQFDSTSDLESDAPEITSVMKWIFQKKFVLSGNLHGGSLVASYPFDDSTSHTASGVYSQTPDDALFRYLAYTYSANHPIMRVGKPKCPDNPDETFKDGITNGAEWYDVQGGMQDFNYLRGNCFEVTFELSCCKYPLASHLYTEWNNNREALLAFMEKVHIGVRGYVMTTSGLGLPDSIISVAGINHNITTWKFGDYYRLLLPGTYNITASSPGYLPKTINVVVNEGRATLLNFTLMDPAEEMIMVDFHTDPAPTTVYYIPTQQNLQTSVVFTPKPTAQPQDFSHHSYLDMELFLIGISTVYPLITNLYSIGQSEQGRELYVMEISTNPGVEQPGKPQVMFVGNLHGGDAVGRAVLWKLVEYLCYSYGSEHLVTRLVNSTRIHVLPSMNPDGYEMTLEAQKYFTANENGNGGVRYSNNQNLDLNRNFPDPSSAADFAQPETAAVMKWMKAHSFILSASVLGGVVGVKYPISDISFDAAIFKSIAEAYFMKNPTLQLKQDCERGNNDLYTSAGTDLQTWAYHNSDTLGVIIGLSCDLFPPAEELLAYWKQNQEALLQFIQQVHLSVRGRVTDVQLGQTIANATIVVEGSRHQVHTSSFGQYWRPLAPGTYQLQAFAPGYAASAVSVQVLETRVEQVDFSLTPQQLPETGEQMEMEEDFQKLIEELSATHGLEKLAQDLLTAETLQYRNYRQRSEFLRGLHLNFPHITRLYSLGHSWEFRSIWALEISAHPESPRPDEPRIRYVAGIHGNAASGPELLLEFASILCLNYGWNPTVTKLINRSRIVIVPCVNPDGRELAEESCFSTSGFTNTHGIDLDTDFLYGNVSVQPETRAMMDMIEGGGFSLSVVLDGGSLLTTYPYDRAAVPAQNEETLRYLASVYSNNHPLMSLGFTGCTHGPESVPGGILRGAEFKSHPGSMKDFSLDVGVCPEITVYTGCCLYPPLQQLHSRWLQHRNALLAMILEVHKGLVGVVRDREGGPVSGAVVSVNNSVLTRTDTRGHFRILLAPGSHQLQVQAHGFLQQLMQVNVSSHHTTSPVVVQFTANSRHISQGALLTAAVCIIAVLLCALLIWHFRTMKFSRVRDVLQRLRRRKDELHMEVIASEKSPLRRVFLEESESEDDAFYLEHH